MKEQLCDPREDISYIKSILEKASDGMKTVAPWFTWFGILWLVYGLWSVTERLVIKAGSASATIRISQAGAVVGWLFYIALAVGFLFVRRKQRQNGLDTMALKLVDIWGACIFLFLALTVCMNVLIPFLAIRVLSYPAEAASHLSICCFHCQSCLIFLLPLLPLIITAIFLENRRMLWAGIVLAALAAIVLGLNILLIWSGDINVYRAWVRISTAAECLLDILPGVMLLLFARDLKRG